jgi:hypothetical protein
MNLNKVEIDEIWRGIGPLDNVRISVSNIVSVNFIKFLNLVMCDTK